MRIDPRGVQQPTNQVDDIYGAQGLKRKGKNTRPVQMNPVKARNDYINQRMLKESETSHGTCDDGTRWVASLGMCVDKGNIDLLKQHANKKRASKGYDLREESRSVLRDALREYDSYRKQPNEKL